MDTQGDEVEADGNSPVDFPLALLLLSPLSQVLLDLDWLGFVVPELAVEDVAADGL